MSRETSVQATEKFGELVNGGRFEAFPEVVAPDCHDHDPAPGQHMGPEGYQMFFTQLRSAFPDMQVEVKKLVADGDSVAFAYTLTGTHQGDFNGHKPTGKAIKVRGMQIGRFVDGKMVERWGSSDELGILKQIGAIEG
ncbi:ester cyclase [Methylobacterium sp. J-078]|uniref:ester cyclase n=1 Tax=Methylobacterium sp. J-078 TaxID=2836657 RepID=UPI001FB8F861|nr:ester cyclase [Methylobacterium sp. J-078]MCJ2045562.1 ester cyclase [Methylobacterium sp. J-078]